MTVPVDTVPPRSTFDGSLAKLAVQTGCVVVGKQPISPPVADALGDGLVFGATQALKGAITISAASRSLGIETFMRAVSSAVEQDHRLHFGNARGDIVAVSA